MNKFFEKYRTEPFFWSRLGFCYDPPRLDDAGKPVVFSSDFSKYRRIHDEFRDAGILHHTTILHSGWVGVDTYDFSLTDATLDALLRDNPTIFYMPRVKLNPPVEWCRQNPTEVFVYANGPQNIEDIRALVGTDKHDWFGLNATGYPVNGGNNAFVDTHQNIDGVIAMQSFSSQKWQQDAATALQKLMEHISHSPYAKQIVGYHIAYGACGETTAWGSWVHGKSNRVGDYGIAAVENFRIYEEQKYGSLANVLHILGLKTREDIYPPTPATRSQKCVHLHDFLFHAENDLLAADYYEFLSNTNVDALSFFCKTVKNYNPQYLTGAFYGYTAIARCAHAGHLAIDRLLACPHIDFLSAPKGYYRCNAGEPGGEEAPSQSMARHKLWLDEIDNKTHLDPRNQGEVKDFNETRVILWREACKNLSRAQGFWWMDLGEGCFSSPEVMEEIRKITAFAAQINTKVHHSVAEVLVVEDDLSQRRHALSYGLHDSLHYHLASKVQEIGAPVDFYRISDMETLDLSRYKLIVFGDTVYFDEGESDRILTRIPPQTMLVWHYAPGALQPHFAWENIQKTCGFSLGERPQSDTDYPQLYIHEQRRMKVLSRYPDGAVETASKKVGTRRHVLAVNPTLTTTDFRAFAKEAGVTLYAPQGTTVYADNRFAAFFAGEEFSAAFTFRGETIKIAPKELIIL